VSNSDPAPTGRIGRTHWKRWAIVMVPVAVVSAVLLAGVGLGAIPVSLAISARSTSFSGQTFQVAADRLEGTGFTQYAQVDTSGKGDFPEAVSGIKSADLYNLCQSVVQKVPVLGSLTVRITAGGGGKPAHASNLAVRTDDLAGDATFSNVIMGVDAAAIGGPAGQVGQQADSVRIDHLRQQTRSVSAATFKLTGLHLTVKAHSSPCF
jgi:hypothetical protein